MCDNKLVQEKLTNKYGEKNIYIKKIVKLSFSNFVLLKIKNVTENL